MYRKKFDVVLRQVADLFQILAHPDRIRLIGMLQKEEMTVSHLHELLQISQSSVSQHLKLLKTHGLVSERREGSYVYYRVKKSGIERVITSAIELENEEYSSGHETAELLEEMHSLWRTETQQ
jgi:DNA-binding transcriptional ArsR family regulator